MPFDIHIKDTLLKLLAHEDTDGDGKITIDDNGPKVFLLESEGNTVKVQGTYYLANLLEILTTEREKGNDFWHIDEDLLFKSSVQKISDQIKNVFWDGLTRTLDEEGLSTVLHDSKTNGDTPIVYVPSTDRLAIDYYSELQEKLGFALEVLPRDISPEFVLSINSRPGILSLKLKKEGESVIAEPFVVPGGRFNEMYGWDSYFQNRGLLIDGRADLAKSTIENFEYEILHYGKILNANRSYYLNRTQPPFFSSMIRELMEHTPQPLSWLKAKLTSAIREYYTVWMKRGDKLTDTGLNRYRAEGIGMPWETEKGHFDAILQTYADRAAIPLLEFEQLYKNRNIISPELDEYFQNDRSVRESGHDTTHRFGNHCMNILPVELNCMLLKYELDFAHIIKEYFGDYFEYNNMPLTSQFWLVKAKTRKQLMEKYFWNEELQMYSDYDFVSGRQTNYHAATCYFPLWVGLPDKDRAKNMLEKLRDQLLEKGGIAASDYNSGGIPNLRSERQWDYPFGWAPHQIIIWDGLRDYNFTEDLQLCVDAWLNMIVENSMNYNGTITEKYNVVEASHKVFAEYGNQGTEFRYITKEGFGWMNASFKIALQHNMSLEKI